MSIRYPRNPIAPRWLQFVCWCFTRRAVLRPIYRSIICNDLLGQAMHLAESGYYVAAVALTRCWLERAINRLTLITPRWQTLSKAQRHFKGFVQYLELEAMISPELAQQIRSMYDNASGIVHGKEVTARKTMGMVRTAAEIRARLEKATIIALSRTNEDEGNPSYPRLIESPVVKVCEQVTSPAEMAVAL